MNFGVKIHKVLEYVDFKNFKSTGDNFIDSKITKLLNSPIMKDIGECNIYKELEFIYNNDTEYHGIIDLMLEHKEYINIIDYKLKDVSSDDYINQLKGYRDYVSKKTTKPINLYLYSIIDGNIKEIK